VRVKLAVLPAHTVGAVGCVVIDGAVFTVNATRVEVTDGLHVPLTTQSKPLAAAAASAVATLLICKVAVLLPL
jgi:hypothetical protein